MKNRFVKIVSSIAIAFSFAFAQRASIKTSAEPTTITIGDRITYKVEITRDPQIKIAWPGTAAELGQFQILDYEIKGPEKLDDGRVRDVFIYIISTFDTGDWIIPPTGITYIDEFDSSRVLYTEPIPIYVKSLLSDEDWKIIKHYAESDTSLAGKERQLGAGLMMKIAKERLLKDVNQPAKIKRNLKRLLIAIALFVLISGTIFLYFYLRKRKGKIGGIFSFSAPPIPPHEWALMEFSALIASQHIAKKEYKEYYTQLSDILRIYIERRIGVEALELSTTETIKNLEGSDFPLSPDTLALVKNCLDRCDLVKFAKLEPPESWHIETIEMGKAFVEMTKPIELPQAQTETKKTDEFEK